MGNLIFIIVIISVVVQLVTEQKKKQQQQESQRPLNRQSGPRMPQPHLQPSYQKPAGKMPAQSRPHAQSSYQKPAREVQPQTSGYTPTSQTSRYTPTSQTSGYTPTSQTSGYTPTSQTSGYTPTSQTSGYTPTPQPVSSPQSEDILGRAVAEVAETAQEDLDISELMSTVNDLMIMGYQADLTFDRDFVSEGIEMLNQYDVPVTE